MYIQYTGFDMGSNSRIYKFQVLDPSRGQRAFTVQILTDTNYATALKLQDGPGICFERVERELARETPEFGAELELHISEFDIRDYIKRHYPPAKTRDLNNSNEHPAHDGYAGTMASSGAGGGKHSL